MGGGVSAMSLEPLRRLSGSEPISAEDTTLWQELFSLHLPSSSAEDLQTASHAFAADMVQNNLASGNLRALSTKAIEMLLLARKPRVSGDVLRQACGCVFLLRLYVKHMVETLEPSELDAHLAAPTGGVARSFAPPLVEALLGALVHVELNEESYWLHMELAATVTVCLSTQLFATLEDTTPQPLVHAALADRSLHLLLVLTQHLPPALVGHPPSEAAPPPNPFLEAVRSVGDTQPFDAPPGGATDDPESGQLRAHAVSFRELHDTISDMLPTPGAALLLYVLLHGNREYLDYSLSRTDPETMLLPLLRTLNDSRSLPLNRLYLLLILLLMLSQDSGFATACQTSMLSSVPWYKQRLLGAVSVGSLLVIILVRTVQANLAGMHDSYVHTNCLAALANLAPHLRKLHPHAARCMLSLVDLLARKHAKDLKRREQTPTPADSGRSDAAEGDAPPQEADADPATMSADLLRIALEALNLTLMAGPALNEHLVYAVLERQALFSHVREHAAFADLLENVDLVVEHFGASLSASGPEEGSGGGDAVWSVDAVLGHIHTAAREWRTERLRPLPDLKFTYEQEPAPEEFFTPYIWQIVYEHAALGWDAERVVLFTVVPPHAAGDVDDGVGLPALSTIDVDEQSGPASPVESTRVAA